MFEWSQSRLLDDTLELFAQSHEGIRPNHKSITAYCGSSATNLNDSSGIPGDVNVVWTDPRDRGIGQDVMLLVECDAAPFLHEKRGTKIHSSGSISFESSAPDALAAGLEGHTVPELDKREMVAHLQDSLSLAFSFDLNMGTVETSSSGPMKLNLQFKTPNLTMHIDESKEEHVKIAACLSPAFYGVGGEMPLLKWLEWREHMRYLGVDRVSWYGRHEGMKDFVDAYNQLRYMKDNFRSVCAH